MAKPGAIILIRGFLIITQFSLIFLVNADFYSSIYKLSLLIKEEHKLISALRKYIHAKTEDNHVVQAELPRYYWHSLIIGTFSE